MPKRLSLPKVKRATSIPNHFRFGEAEWQQIKQILGIEQPEIIIRKSDFQNTDLVSKLLKEKILNTDDNDNNRVCFDNSIGYGELIWRLIKLKEIIHKDIIEQVLTIWRKSKPWQQLQTISIGYLYDEGVFPHNPSIPKNALKKINKQTKDLLNNLNFDYPTTIWFCDKIKFQEIDFIQLQQDLENFHDYTRKSLRELPIDKGGRPSTNEPLEIYINKLAELYEDITGKRPTLTGNQYNVTKPYGGRFFNFVEFCLDHIESPPDSNQSLGSAIRLVLKRLKRQH